MCMYLLISTILFGIGYCQLQTGPVVTIEDGQIRGKIAKTVGKGLTYYAFQGIPYAKPPLKQLRFQAPVQNDKWEGILDATADKNQCLQLANPAVGSEDCLYINVYTTTLNKSNFAVLTYIHGGGFLLGNSSYESQGPDYLLDEGELIFVEFNYRVGVFGFISTGDLVSPGNVGLKDQQLALKWIQKNIVHFGGDPKKVTIFGISAGAASVAYHLQAKSSLGLFRGSILNSGSSLCLWALARDARQIAFEIGKTLKVDTTNSTTLISGLKDIDSNTLQEVAFSVSNRIILPNILAGLMFSPVIEPYHKDAFFYNNSDQLLSQGEFAKVPILIGTTSNEGAGVKEIPVIVRGALLKYDFNNSLLTPADLTSDGNLRSFVGSIIKIRYFGLLPIAVQTDSVVNFISDDLFNRPIIRTVRDVSKYVPTYYYKFSYQGSLGGVPNRKLKGVGHSEDVGYLFRSSNTANVSTTVDDRLMQARMTKLWTNFAKTLNPTPTQDPLLQSINWITAGIIPNNLVYLNIDIEMELALNPFKENMEFYDKLYKDYGSAPYNTY